MSAVNNRVISAVGRYLAIVTASNLVWEIAHLPLYTIWKDGGIAEKAFAVIHCTGGDFLISLAALVMALLTVGTPNWPHDRFFPVAVTATFLGVTYTAFSEWMNISVRSSWAYSDLMPVIEAFGFGFGVSPLLQWIMIPSLGFLLVKWRHSGAVPIAAKRR